MNKEGLGYSVMGSVQVFQDHMRKVLLSPIEPSWNPHHILAGHRYVALFLNLCPLYWSVYLSPHQYFASDWLTMALKEALRLGSVSPTLRRFPGCSGTAALHSEFLNKLCISVIKAVGILIITALILCLNSGNFTSSAISNFLFTNGIFLH